MSESSTTMTDLLPNPHPGEILLEEFLKPMGVSQNALARAVHVPPRSSSVFNPTTTSWSVAGRSHKTCRRSSRERHDPIRIAATDPKPWWSICLLGRA